MVGNNKNCVFSLLTLILISTIMVSSLILLLSSSFDSYVTIILTKAAYGQNNDSNSIILRGGGTGSITCPDGSSNKAVIAFVVSGNSSTGKITTTNWNI